MSNIRCTDCSTPINPTANTHTCNCLHNFPCSTQGEFLHNDIGNHCRLPNCPYPHNVCTSDECPVCSDKKPEALTPLGELARAIQVFRNKMSQDRCYSHCKTYQEEIKGLCDFAEQISKG